MICEEENLEPGPAGSGKKPPIALESLEKGELVQRCKNLLQLAQKAKKAKDDALKKNEDLRSDNEKEKKTLLDKISTLESKDEDNNDFLKVKQRQLERLTEENDSLLQKMDVFSSELKIAVKEKTELKKEAELLRNQCQSLEKKTVKSMELEANLICLKENEKKTAVKFKQLEENLAIEKKLGNDKNNQIELLSEKLEAKTEEGSSFKKLVEDLEGKLTSVNCEGNNQSENIQQLEKQINEQSLEQESRIQEVKTLKIMLTEKNEQLTLSENAQKLTIQIQKENEQKTSGLIEELNQLNEEMKKRGERIDKLQQINSELQEKKLNNDQKHNELVSTVTKVEKDLEQKSSDFETKIGEIKSLNDEMDVLVVENKNNIENCKILEAKNNILIKTNEDLLAELEVFKVSKINKEATNETLTLLHSNLEKAGRDKDSLNDTLKSLQGDLEVAKNNAVLKEKEADNFINLNKNLNEEKDKLTEKLREAEEKLTKANNDVEIAHSDKDSLATEIKSVQELLQDTQNKLSLYENETIELRDQNEKLKEEIGKMVANFKETEGELKAVRKTADMLKEKAVKEESVCLRELQEKLRSADTKVLEKMAEQEENKTTILCLRKEITNLSKENQENNGKVKELRDKHEKKEQELLSQQKGMESQIQTLSNQIVDLKGEVAHLKTNVHNESQNTSNVSMTDNNDDSKSEAMSTSTVSKAEEHNRMKDIEDSFEDRYSKLKLIAIKLKKKCGDQAKLIQELEAKCLRGGDGSGGLKDKFSTLTKNFTTLQTQYDSTFDKLENTEGELKTLKKDLEASMTESVGNKQKSEESIQQALSARTELTKVEDKARELEVKVSALEITLEEEKKERNVLEENSRQNVDLASKLRDKVGENFMIEETLQNLKLQISQLEESLAREQERADQGNKVLASTRGQLTNTEAEMSRWKVENDETVKKYEETTRASELLQEQIAEIIQTSEKEQGIKTSKIQQLERQVAALEATSVSSRDELQTKEKELSRISREYEGYKLRAQSVLKQSRDGQVQESEQKKQEELFAMEKMNDALNDKLKSVSLELRTLAIEKKGMEDEHERLMERHSLLLQELAGKERSWRERTEQQEKRARQLEEDRVVSGERITKSMESLKQVHLQEMETARNGYHTELGRLKKQLDSSENEVIRLGLVLQKEQEVRRQQQEEGTFMRSRHMEQDGLDICQIEREAAEGQEVEPSVGFSPTSTLTSPVPLEDLLNSQTDLTSASGMRSSSSSRAGGPDRQVAHLAALLSESEAQNSRLEKLTEVLKEEIRTVQRSEERHKHIENLEYVKNIILKFITLTGAGERAGLIPVLRTILKLKQEEVKKIEEVVNAQEDLKGGQEGWGSYLHLWSTAP